MPRPARFVAAAVRQVRSSMVLLWTRQAPGDAAAVVTPVAPHGCVPTRQPVARASGFPAVAEGAD
jgi:hypothetical protein